MSKLKLSLDELRVESFHTAAPADARGTVRGAEDAGTNQSGCIIASCGVTCPISCEPSCPYAGCDGTANGCDETNASGSMCGDTCAVAPGDGHSPG
jgi:hypothetical protein